MNRRPPALLTITENPYNAETPLSGLESEHTPSELVYVRNHFDVPQINLEDWHLEVSGAIQSPDRWTLDELRTLPEAGETVTLECAGNGRSGMDPSPVGTPWGFGAVSFIQCRGTSLVNILRKAGVASDAVEVLFIGEDSGEVYEGRTEVFARSLPLDLALNPLTLLVWDIDGVHLTPEHGYPLRLIVPSWYGMASVKWLREIRVITEPFTGFFQAEHYVYQKDAVMADGQPVKKIRPRSLITYPEEGMELEQDETEIRGVAWTGDGSISQVMVSTDGGDQWNEASLSSPTSDFGGQHWRIKWAPEKTGEHVILSRAIDSDGNHQPVDHLWNELGYGNNGIHPVTLQVI